MIEEVLDVEREIRSDIHEITAKAKKPFQDHFWKDHFCDSGSAAADRFFRSVFSTGWEIIFILYMLVMCLSAHLL